MSDFIALEFDAEKQVLEISKQLGALKGQTPAILKNAINAAGRKVRKQIIKDTKDRYAITNNDLLKKTSQGAPRLQTAKQGDFTAAILSKGPMNDLTDFMVNPTSTGVQAKVLQSSSMKLLENNGLKAFITQFASGHVAVVQRDPDGKYTVRGAMDRIEKYGRPSGGKWPDMTRIKKLLSPAVPHMLANAEIREKATDLLRQVLDAEIQKRIEKALKKSA